MVSVGRIEPRVRTPAALGYRMPAEWEPHRATWLAWPHKEDSWPGKLTSVVPIWVEMVRWLVRGEEVHILVNDSAPAGAVRARLEEGHVPQERVHLHEVPTDDAWLRDSGPTFLTRPSAAGGDIGLVDWTYNAWGGKYPPWERDNLVPRRLAELLASPRFEAGLVLEGGSIDVNGEGTLLTTESCLLHPNRNPTLDRADIESRLRDYLGVRHILWLGDGIAGDDTDGHVDDLARFVAPDTIVTVVEEDPADENYAPLKENWHRLSAMKDQSGRPLRIVPLPMPSPLYFEDTRLPASYANFYIANAVVLVPIFGDRRDGEALATLRALFPGRRVIGLNAVDLVWGLGAFHCITQQQPST